MTFFDTTVLVRLGYIFCISFLLNLAWEFGHAPLYAAYQGAVITNLVLLKATAGDALFLTALSIPFFRHSWLKKRLWIAIPVGIAAAICLELFALSTGRWEYTVHMPLIPWFAVGLTPSIQLGVLGFISYWITNWRQEKSAVE